MPPHRSVFFRMSTQVVRCKLSNVCYLSKLGHFYVQIIQMQVARPTLTVAQRQIEDEEKQRLNMTNNVVLDNPLSTETLSRKRYFKLADNAYTMYRVGQIKRCQLTLAIVT